MEYFLSDLYQVLHMLNVHLYTWYKLSLTVPTVDVQVRLVL